MERLRAGHNVGAAARQIGLMRETSAIGNIFERSSNFSSRTHISCRLDADNRPGCRGPESRGQSRAAAEVNDQLRSPHSCELGQEIEKDRKRMWAIRVI